MYEKSTKLETDVPFILEVPVMKPGYPITVICNFYCRTHFWYNPDTSSLLLPSSPSPHREPRTRTPTGMTTARCHIDNMSLPRGTASRVHLECGEVLDLFPH